MDGTELDEKGPVAERVKALVAQAAGTSVSALTAETRLLEDLSLVGDDAALLLETFSTEFGVDLKGLVFSDHFPRDGWHGHRALMLFVIAALSPRFRRILKSRRQEERSISIAHLVKVAQAGRWLRPAETRTGEGAAVLARTLDPVRPFGLLTGLGALVISGGFFALGLFSLVAAFTESPTSGAAFKYLIAGLFSCALLPVFLVSGWWDSLAYLRGHTAPNTN